MLIVDLQYQKCIRTNYRCAIFQVELCLTLVKCEKREAHNKRLEIPYSVELSILLESFPESSARIMSVP
jgi:hypothetical protein